jgi:COP9 signalosome complex subunit 3
LVLYSHSFCFKNKHKMDKIIGSIQSCDPNSEKELRNLRTILQKSDDVLFKNLPHLDDALAMLDPGIHTLGWIAILSIKAAVPNIDAFKFVTQARLFFPLASTVQVRMLPGKFYRICQRFIEIYQEQGAFVAAIKPIKTALFKLRPNSETLTPLHADFLQLCLLAKDYRAALSVLAEEPLNIANPESYNFKPRDMLRYFYYGGMVYTGVKDFGKAVELFKHGFTAPAAVLSAIMVECYKKYTLVSLLHSGSVKPVPKYTSPIVQRHLKSTCPAYQEFVNAYGTNSTDEVHKVATQHVEVFQKDNNFGLVKQCIQALYRSNIKRHTQTYLTLSLVQIAESVKLASPKDAERAILRMIEEGQIHASINQKDGMVSFLESPEQYNDNNVLNHIDQQIRRTIELSTKLRLLDREIASSPGYIQKTMMQERGGRWDMDEFDLAGGPPGGMRGMGKGMGGRKAGKSGKGMKLAN